jgi:hypothetical protein
LSAFALSAERSNVREFAYRSQPCVAGIQTALSLGVVLAKENVNLGDALGSEIEGCDLFCGHAKENFILTGVRLLLQEGVQFLTQAFELF